MTGMIEQPSTQFNQGGYDSLFRLQALAGQLTPLQEALAQKFGTQVPGLGGMPTAAQQQLSQGIYEAQQAQISAGRGVRGVAPGIAQALAARNAAGVEGRGAQQMAMLQAQERAAASQQLAQAGLAQQQMELDQNLARTEQEQREVAARMAQQSSYISGGLSVVGGVVGAYGGPEGAAAGYSAGRAGGNLISGALQQG